MEVGCARGCRLEESAGACSGTTNFSDDGEFLRHLGSVAKQHDGPVRPRQGPERAVRQHAEEVEVADQREG